MAARYYISVGTTCLTIMDVIHAKSRKKRPVHRLYRAWSVYRRLSNEKYKNYVTSDEAWFYLD
ncbi:unnamed protein product, partial [Rotaria magnacalcarata]